MYIICFLFPGRTRKTCQLILLGFFIFLILDALVALNMAMASPFWFMMMCLQYLYLGFACLFMVPLCTIPLCLACPAAAYFCFITLFVEIRRALRRPSRFDLTRRNLRKGIRKLAFWFAMLMVGSVALSGPFTMVGIVLPSIFSDIGLANVPFSMGELDQWAALCSGVITFAFSAYEAIPWKVLIVAYVDVWRKLTSPLWDDSAQGHGYERAKLEV
ncbi:hypothetical protein F5X68DRAFT_217969 [Plectosphaerella plurivora]|uniref:Uncharacterized protein n=1 Tax=Plectosphaerella plurivora TaxID=936078 RepID=A0A9P8V150_9PEZI|nr:hypothetical protein F5X68DRAFT_217969 [Plectosphaerella plurivora]